MYWIARHVLPCVCLESVWFPMGKSSVLRLWTQLAAMYNKHCADKPLTSWTSLVGNTTPRQLADALLARFQLPLMTTLLCWPLLGLAATSCSTFLLKTPPPSLEPHCRRRPLLQLLADEEEESDESPENSQVSTTPPRWLWSYAQSQSATVTSASGSPLVDTIITPGRKI